MGEWDPFDDNAPQTKKGWLTAILELGAWLGTLLSGFLAETISRKYGILVACVVFIIGCVIQAVSIQAGPAAILVGRFVTYDTITSHFVVAKMSLVRWLTKNTVVWVLEVLP
jgi:MFS family permease